LWGKRKITSNEGKFGPTYIAPHLTPSNRPSFASLPRDLHDDATCTTHRPPSLILRQNWETLAWLALHRSKPSDVDTCPHTVFICSSVLSHKPINLLPLGFEVQTMKPSQWFWGPNHQTVDLCFEAQTKKPSRWFWGPNHKTIATSFEAKLGNLRCSSPLLHVYDADLLSPEIELVNLG
jgi:hypothetical protein